jgi:hypothetical protein
MGQQLIGGAFLARMYAVSDVRIQELFRNVQRLNIKIRAEKS